MLELVLKNPAPGRPGIEPRWTAGAKEAVGTAYSVSNRLWYTIANGVTTEIYYPTIDMPQVRDLQYMVSDGETFFHDERRNTTSKVEAIDPAALGFRVINSDPEGRYSIEKQIIGDPHLNCLLVHTKFNVAPEWQGRLHLYVLCAPHLKIGGYHNNAEIAEARGRKYLLAYRDNFYLAISNTNGFRKLSCRLCRQQRRLDRSGAQLDDGLGVRLRAWMAMSRSPAKSICRRVTSSHLAWPSPAAVTPSARRWCSRYASPSTTI